MNNKVKRTAIVAGAPKEVLDTKRRCNALLANLVGPELVDRWWTSPNLAFDGKPPLEADIDHVFSYLLSHAFGGEYF